MILRVALLLLGLAQAAQAACNCPKNITTYSGTFSILSPYDDITLNNCYPIEGQCTVNSYFNSSLGLGNFFFNQFDDPTNNFQFIIMDGTVYNITVTAKKLQDPDFRQALKTYKPYSATQTLLLAYGPNNYTVEVRMYAYPLPLQSQIPTTAPATTPQIATLSNGSPSPAGWLGVDLAINIDTALLDANTFTTMRNVIESAVSELTVVTDYNADYGARLLLQTMARSAKPNQFGDPWHITLTQFSDMLSTIPFSGVPSSLWEEPLKASLSPNGFFDPTWGNETRPQTERVYAIFTKHMPDDDPALVKAQLEKLAFYDVHMVIFDFSDSGLPALQALVDGVPNCAYKQYDPSNPGQFLNDYLLGSDADSNFGCSKGFSDSKSVNVTRFTYTWPPNYADPPAVPPARYCNKQNSKLMLQTDDGMGNICINVSRYDLEVELDFVRFFDTTTERAYLTGTEIKSTSFTLYGSAATIFFSSNDYNVYGGISFTARKIEVGDECP